MLEVEESGRTAVPARESGRMGATAAASRVLECAPKCSRGADAYARGTGESSIARGTGESSILAETAAAQPPCGGFACGFL